MLFRSCTEEKDLGAIHVITCYQWVMGIVELQVVVWGWRTGGPKEVICMAKVRKSTNSR